MILSTIKEVIFSYKITHVKVRPFLPRIIVIKHLCDACRGRRTGLDSVLQYLFMLNSLVYSWD